MNDQEKSPTSTSTPLPAVFGYIGWICLALWLMSLGLNAIILYNGDVLVGGAILLWGWVGPLITAFSWYANPFFLYAVIVISPTNKPPIKSSAIAFCLALASFTFSDYPLNEGGSTAPVYGYGWGFVLWLGAIVLVLTSSLIIGFHQTKENTESNHRNPLLALQIIGIVYAIIFIAVPMNYWLNANSEEKAFISEHSVAIKRNTLCEIEISSLQKTSRTDGPLELILNTEIPFRYPFNNVSTILNWGQPVVRKNGFDYFYSFHDYKYTLSAREASGSASATLMANSSRNQGNSNSATLNMRLISSVDNEVYFEQNWRVERTGISRTVMCPSYSSFPSKEDQPRKLLVDALEIDSEVTAEESSSQFIPLTLSEKTVIPVASLENFPDTQSCPAHIGRIVDSSPQPFSSNAFGFGRPRGLSFQVGETYYSVKNFGGADTQVICDSESIYLFRISRSEGRDGQQHLRISISKRKLDDFGELWAGSISTSDPVLETIRSKLSITGFDISESIIKLGISVGEARELLLVLEFEAPLI